MRSHRVGSDGIVNLGLPAAQKTPPDCLAEVPLGVFALDRYWPKCEVLQSSQGGRYRDRNGHSIAPTRLRILTDSVEKRDCCDAEILVIQSV